MIKQMEADYLGKPVSSIARRDFAALHQDFSVRQALDNIRSHGLGERIVYFYVVDDSGRLTGVIPTRRLLVAPLEQRISELMIKRVVVIGENATILEAHELLAGNKFLALPVVDKQGHLAGIIDIGMFTDRELELFERAHMDEVFESIGFRVSQIQNASPVRAFRIRLPWLTATIASGLICALLTSFHDVTLAQSLMLAFFLTLVLGLGESVSMQSMPITIQALRTMQPTLKWVLRGFGREAGMAFLLGATCGLAVGLIVLLWRGDALAAAMIGGSITLIVLAGCLFGLSIPTLLHALKLDPKIAAGPVTLAIADICTILLYFNLATLLL